MDGSTYLLLYDLLLKNRYCAVASWEEDVSLRERAGARWPMNRNDFFPSCRFALVISFALCLAIRLTAQIVPTNDPPVYGPYNAIILQGGAGLKKAMVARDTVLRADAPWTIYLWVQSDWPIA